MPKQASDYQDWLNHIKQRVVSTRMRMALAANSELIRFYWELGEQIVERETQAKWGSGFIDTLSKDLRSAFPELTGLSAKNLRYCRAFFRFYCQAPIWQQPVAKLPEQAWQGVSTELAAVLGQIPWGHNIQILTKCANQEEAGFYISQTLEQGWSRDVLALQLKSRLHERAGKLNFYLSAVDSLLKKDGDQPSIGLLLCRDKNNIEVEFALRDMNKPMGVSEYSLVESLPDNLKGALPTVEEIEQDLRQISQAGDAGQ